MRVIENIQEQDRIDLLWAPVAGAFDQMCCHISGVIFQLQTSMRGMIDLTIKKDAKQLPAELSGRSFHLQVTSKQRTTNQTRIRLSNFAGSHKT